MEETGMPVREREVGVEFDEIPAQYVYPDAICNMDIYALGYCE